MLLFFVLLRHHYNHHVFVEYLLYNRISFFLFISNSITILIYLALRFFSSSASCISLAGNPMSHPHPIPFHSHLVSEG